jgi:hypothetical protein
MCGYKFNINNIKLLKSITDKGKLDEYESDLLFKNKKREKTNIREHQIHHYSNFWIIIKATIFFLCPTIFSVVASSCKYFMV